MTSKICFILSKLDAGGLENYLLRFLTYYKNDIKAYVICKSGYKGHELVAEYEKIGVKVVPLRLKYFNLINYIKLYNYFKKEEFVSVCDFTGNFAALPLLIGKMSGIRTRIAFFRKNTNTFKETKLKLLYNKYLNILLPKVTTKILSNSRSNFNFFFEKQYKKNPLYEIIYNGINANDFLSSEENLRDDLDISIDAFVVGHVGRYNIAKNHKTIIHVAEKICSKNKDVYFILCGKNTDTFLSKRVKKEGLENQIKLLGFRTDVVKVLNTLDCFYFPSFSEGQPNALIEAMLTGIPVVASDIEPNKETVPREYHEKFLVEPKNIEGAINKIIEIKNNPNFRKDYNLSEWIRSRYSPEVLFKKFYQYL